jgi:phage shock protein PspC (stress-responsive transcriptional regulator)
MQGERSNLFTREDTLLGICEALGQDFGFNPIYLRITLAVLLLWNPKVVIVSYLAAGVVVLATRLLFPERRTAKAVVASTETVEPQADNQDQEELAVAA